MESESFRKILICGGGLAGWMAAARLAHALPSDYEITVLDLPNSDAHDDFFGSVLSPHSYAFNLAAGVSEPVLFRETNAMFSWGTQYSNWGMTSKSWVQCFHLPFPVWNGIPFTQYIAQRPDENLEAHLISAQAVQRGVFAHPPEDSGNPLSRAEYGYQASPSDLTHVFRKAALRKNVKTVQADTFAVSREGLTIEALKLPDGQTLQAGLYIDCTGPDAKLLSGENAQNNSERTLKTLVSEFPNSKPGSPACRIRSGDYGWQSETSIRGKIRRLTVYHEQSEGEAMTAHGSFAADKSKIVINRKVQAWRGNCVALGHAASVIEPITPAPLMLLQRDIDRLLRLIPITMDMELEAREYNRGFEDDYQHAALFNQAFFALGGLPHTPYWLAAKNAKQDDKLTRKLTQFESRGLLVTYDLEPFNEQDWAILHFGIGRQPTRLDPLTALADTATIDRQLQNLGDAIDALVKKMPPHDRYLHKFIDYLERKHDT
jgi:tryptophan halogenase